MAALEARYLEEAASVAQGPAQHILGFYIEVPAAQSKP